MNLVFVTEARFFRLTDGVIVGDASFDKNLWSRYLKYFTNVYVVARIKEAATEIEGKVPVESPGVTFCDLPYYLGVTEYLRKRGALKHAISRIINGIEATYVCRVPGKISDLFITELLSANKEYGVEVVGDPWDVFAPGAIRHPMRALLRVTGYLQLRRNISRAKAVLYVTKTTLQSRYPARKDVFQIGASDVKIAGSSLAPEPKRLSDKTEIIVLSIGSLEQMYKSPDIVLQAVRHLTDRRIPVKLIWLGDGAYLERMVAYAAELGLSEIVNFKGNVSSDEVKTFLGLAQVFALVSRTEGMPRAMIEAMASALPCIGTRVGGIPELLDDNMLIPKNDYVSLANKIEELINNDGLYYQQSQRNLKEAGSYVESVLEEKRAQFYENIKLLATAH